MQSDCSEGNIPVATMLMACAQRCRERVGLCAGAGRASADESILGHTANDGWFDDAMEVVNFKVKVGTNRDLEVSEDLNFDTVGTGCYNAL